MPADKRLFCGALRTEINIRRIKIGKACVQERVHHMLDLLNIRKRTFFRQPHKTETKLFHNHFSFKLYTDTIIAER